MSEPPAVDEEPSSRVEFERLPVRPGPTPPPHVEILFPYSGKLIPSPKSGTYEVRLLVEHWSGAVQLALDEYRPIVVPSSVQRIRLLTLVPADRELEPGTHRLFAAAVDERNVLVKPSRPSSRGPFAEVFFRVGARTPLPKEAAFIAYSQPRGTYNGDAAADGVFVDFYLVGMERYPESRIRLEVMGHDTTWTKLLDSWQPVAIRGLPSGDYDVALQAVGPHGAPIDQVAPVRRTITVNRDAPVPDGVEGGE